MQPGNVLRVDVCQHGFANAIVIELDLLTKGRRASSRQVRRPEQEHVVESISGQPSRFDSNGNPQRTAENRQRVEQTPLPRLR